MQNTQNTKKYNENIYAYAERITKEGERVQIIRNFIQGLNDKEVKIQMEEWFNKHTNAELSSVVEEADKYQNIENDSIPDFDTLL